MIRAAAYGLSAAAIWGGMYVVSDVVLETIPPFALLSLRLILGALALGIIVAGRSGTSTLTRRDILTLLGVGIVGFGVSLGFQFLGTALSTAVSGALVTSASPAFILLFAALLLRERLTPLRVLAVGLATVGVVIIVNPGPESFGTETFLGDLSLAGAALTWGLYSVLVRMVSGRHDTMIVTFYALVGGMIIALPLGGVEIATQGVGMITPGIIAGVLYLGLISTALAMWLWNRAFALTDASIAALFFFAQPLTGALLGSVLLGQQMTGGLWLGGGLILGGVLLALLRDNRDRQDKPESSA